MMASQKASFCSDEELLNELKKLGFNDVPPDVFQLMKDELSELVDKEQYLSEVSDKDKKRQSSSIIDKYAIAQNKYGNKSGKLTEKLEKSQSSEEVQTNDQISTNSSVLKDVSDMDDPLSKYRNRFKNYKRRTYPREQVDRLPCENAEVVVNPVVNSETSSSSVSVAGNYPRVQNKFKQLCERLPDIQKSRLSPEANCAEKLSSSSSFCSLSGVDDSFNKYQSRCKLSNFTRMEGNKVPEENEEQNQLFNESRSLSSPVSLAANKIKRKVLRHKDGKPVITEEFLDIPNLFNSSYPETENMESSKSFSSDGLSWKSNGSTGSASVLSPLTLNGSQSMYSVSTPRSLHLRFAKPRKKKNDPVTMYNYYKKFWNNFKPPGEKSHDRLRWAVRDKMLDYNL